MFHGITASHHAEKINKKLKHMLALGIIVVAFGFFFGFEAAVKQKSATCPRD
jgi:vacuolar-type H+-ATPase subunit I/STV1